MGSFVEGVDFDTIAREWRCKWSAEGDKKSLAEAQKVLNEMLPTIKSIDGVKSVHRIVCGGNLDFKVSVGVAVSLWRIWMRTERKFHSGSGSVTIQID